MLSTMSRLRIKSTRPLRKCKIIVSGTPQKSFLGMISETFPTPPSAEGANHTSLGPKPQEPELNQSMRAESPLHTLGNQNLLWGELTALRSRFAPISWGAAQGWHEAAPSALDHLAKLVYSGPLTCSTQGRQNLSEFRRQRRQFT